MISTSFYPTTTAAPPHTLLSLLPSLLGRGWGRGLFLLLSFLASTLTAQDLRGRVTCEGRGVAGVVVTDGTDCVQTDSRGYYRLEAKRGVRFVYLTTPAGYLVPCSEGSIPQFYRPVRPDDPKARYDFELKRNPLDDNRHLFTVQADAQVTSMQDIQEYAKFLEDMRERLAGERGRRDVFGIDCGDIVGDSPHLYPASIQAAGLLDMPVWRAIGNHDMTYGGRTFEYSTRTFEEYFGPVRYSFDKGQAHYIVLDNCFYVNRDYQYIGYIDEQTFQWLEQDLAFVPKEKLLFVIVHIPLCLTKELKWNTLIQDETSNAAGLYDLLKGYNVHVISGHTHFNLNVCRDDSLMEHNTAAVCGIWWKADICMDGTPAGYGVYEVDGTQVKWFYKSAGHPDDYQMRVYPAGTDREHPEDIIANVWNWDERWKVEWYEDGQRMDTMACFTGYDPEAKRICDDKERVVYDWIAPVPTGHLFRATPRRADARIEVRATDRFGTVYRQTVKRRKPALMWIDAEANFGRFNCKDSIDFYLEKVKSLGFTHVVVDVRPITGEVLWESRYAPRMEEWKGARRGDFDYLGYFIGRGHALGLEVHASLNIFCAGHNYFDRGMIYSGHSDWASIVYHPDRGLIPITEEKEKYGAMVNPLNGEYRRHMLDLLKELVEKYPALDGLMLDRVRYDGISADFSDLSRRTFEEYIGTRVKRFPTDILRWKHGKAGERPVPEWGRWAKKWFEWRAGVIKDFMAEMRREVKAVRPDISFGTYTGAWYPSYYEVGVNFASSDYDPSEEFDWATPDYRSTGYAGLIDLYVTGNYYTDITIDDYRKANRLVWNETDSQAQQGTWYCVEGSCRNLRRILKGHRFVGGILVDQFYDHPEKLTATIRENLRDADGLMVFDIVHIITRNLWKEVEEGMRESEE